jgi:arsenate reductase
MGCQNACPFTGIPTEDWGLPDPKGQPLAAVRLIRDEIEKRVSCLVREIAGE